MVFRVGGFGFFGIRKTGGFIFGRKGREWFFLFGFIKLVLYCWYGLVYGSRGYCFLVGNGFYRVWGRGVSGWFGRCLGRCRR